MPEQHVAENLRRLPLFSRLPEAELAELGERVRTKTFRRGESIFRRICYALIAVAVVVSLPLLDGVIR